MPPGTCWVARWLETLSARPYTTGFPRAEIGGTHVDRARNAGLPGRSPRTAESDDPFPVQPQGNLPARADLQRIRCQRQAALSRAVESGTARQGRRAGD